jgi:hypothetical protein
MTLHADETVARSAAGRVEFTRLDAGHLWQEDQPDIALTEIHQWITDAHPNQPDDPDKDNDS